MGWKQAIDLEGAGQHYFEMQCTIKFCQYLLFCFDVIEPRLSMIQLYDFKIYIYYLCQI
jgi:hypothetical protein